MRHQDAKPAWQDIIKRAVRGANHKATHTVTDGPQKGGDLLTVNLTVGHVQRSVLLAAGDLEKASGIPSEYEKLRHRIKRAIERALHAARSHFVFASKTVRPGTESTSFFRPGGGRR